MMNPEDHFADQKSVEKLLYEDESYAIRGAIFEVYRVLGSGFLEAVYQESLQIEFSRRQIPFKAQVELPLVYKDQPLLQIYRADFICFEKIIVEIKAIKDIGDEHRAQVFNYLKATNYRLGLLVNFSHYPKVTIERIVL
jgi:GxxExxY protein